MNDAIQEQQVGMKDQIKDRIIALIAAQAQWPDGAVSDDTELKSLGLDSLRLVELMFAIEEAFDVSLPYANAADDDSFANKSVADLRRLIESLLAQKAA